jgi:predicted ATPase
LDLTQKIVARKVNETEIDLQVSRLRDVNPDDMVSIADVGFGVSQILPVLVALRAADEGRLVYLEEPEIHLHPRAQAKLADILADAAKRGVRVVAETHSSLLLTAIQTLVAKGELDAKLVKLHWFQRDPKTGITQVCSANLDENGAFGDWPEDFDAVALDSASGYLDAVEDRKVP